MSTESSNVPPHVLISYDLDINHKEVKDALFAIGYQESVNINGVESYLPETTLFKKYISITKAFDDISRIVKIEKAVLKRCVATQCFDIAVI